MCPYLFLFVIEDIVCCFLLSCLSFPSICYLLRVEFRVYCQLFFRFIFLLYSHRKFKGKLMNYDLIVGRGYQSCHYSFSSPYVGHYKRACILCLDAISCMCALVFPLLLLTYISQYAINAFYKLQIVYFFNIFNNFIIVFTHMFE